MSLADRFCKLDIIEVNLDVVRKYQVPDMHDELLKFPSKKTKANLPSDFTNKLTLYTNLR